MGKGTKQWFQQKIDLKRQHPCVKAPFMVCTFDIQLQSLTVSGEKHAFDILFFCRTLPTSSLPLLYSMWGWTFGEHTLKPLLKLISLSITPDISALIRKWLTCKRVSAFCFLKHEHLIFIMALNGYTSEKVISHLFYWIIFTL